MHAGEQDEDAARPEEPPIAALNGPASRRPAAGDRRGLRALVWSAAALILLLHGALAISSLAVKSVTNDEISHLPAGLAAVETGEIRLNPEHPPLVKLLAGLSASTVHPVLPLTGQAYASGNQWAFGRQVLFELGNDHRALLFRGRLPIVALSMLGALAVFLWSRQRFGDGGGLLSLALFAFSPTVLAHGRLVTMDAAVTTGAVWTLYLWWRLTRRPGEPDGGPRRGRAVACGLALGLTLGAKFSGLILLPAMALVQAVPLLTELLGPAPSTVAGSGERRRSRSRWWTEAWARLRSSLPPWVWVLPVAVVVVELLYLPPDDPLRYLRDVGGIYSANDPNAPTYLHGQFRMGSFPQYFAVALAVKTSLAGLAAMAGGLLTAGVAAARRQPRWRDDLYLWLPAVLWFAVHSALALDLGVRYVLPLYPLLFVLAGGIVPALRRLGPAMSTLPQALVMVPPLVLILAQASTALAAHPDYLPFFNRLAGGALGGIHWLDDSNLDWGQDLERLPAWLEAHGVERPRMLYYGAGLPMAYGVEREAVLPSDWWESPRPGDYVISAEFLIRGLYLSETKGAASDWLLRYRPADVLGGTLYLYRVPPPTAVEAERDDGHSAR